MIKSHNFGAGPCILPKTVFEQAAEAVKNFNGSGLSILEISHRSKAFVDVIEEARELLLKLMRLSSKTHTALFMHGGASLQFAMAPYNFLSQSAGYINTGVWSKKAIAEAKKIGGVTLLFDGEEVDYKSVPNKKELEALPTEGYDYIHLTSNNTIYGTQFKDFNTLGSP
ncbi:MAG: aminotransferase class V-fold PLP-dependent enzyme, partial [Flavobacteriaceae bacterium]